MIILCVSRDTYSYKFILVLTEYLFFSSEVKQSKSEPLTKETDANKKPVSASKKEVASKITDQPIVEESSEYETETDEEGLLNILTESILA